MKNLKNVLAALAFIFAVGAAFASTIKTVDVFRMQVQGDQGQVSPGATCSPASVSLNCDSGSSSCDVQDGSTWYRYYPTNECLTPFPRD